jgi:hypothetical protein
MGKYGKEEPKKARGGENSGEQNCDIHQSESSGMKIQRKKLVTFATQIL